MEVEKVESRKSSKVKDQPASAKIENNSIKKSSASKTLIVLSLVIVIAALSATFILIPELRFWEKLLHKNQGITQSKSDSLNKAEDKKIEAIQTDTALTKKDSLNTKIDQKITDNNIKKTALHYEEPKVQDSRTFYLIVGSFGKIENAQKLLEIYKQKGFNPEIIKGSNMFRVSIGKTTDKNRALNDFNKFRSENPNESVWLLGV